MYEKLRTHYSGNWGALITDVFMFLIITLVMYSMTGKYYDTSVSFARNLPSMTICMSVLYFIAIASYTIYTKFKYFKGIRFYEVCLFAYMVWILVCTVMSDYAITSFSGLVGGFTAGGILSRYCECIIVLFVGRYCKFTDRHIMVACCILATQAVIVIVQLLGGDPFGFYGGSNYYGAGITTNMARSFAGTIGNVGLLCNVAGMFLVIFFLFGLGTKTKNRYIPLIISFVWIALVLFLGPQAAILGTVTSLLLVTPLVLNLTCKKRIIYYSVLFTVGISAFILVCLVDIPITTLHEIYELAHGRPNDHYATGRIKIWRETLITFKGNLLFGHGPDTMGFNNVGYFSRFDDKTGIRYVQVSVDPHCRYLKLMYDGGIPLLVTWVGFTFSIIVGALRRLRSSKYAVYLIGGCVMWLVSYVFSVSYLHTDFYLYLAFGCLGSEVIHSKPGGFGNE